MSVLTDVLKKKDKRDEGIPETEAPSEADLDEVGHPDAHAADAEVSEAAPRELSVDDSDPEVVADAIADLEATDPNETARVSPELVLEDTMVSEAEGFGQTAQRTVSGLQAFRNAEAAESASEATAASPIDDDATAQSAAPQDDTRRKIFQDSAAAVAKQESTRRRKLSLALAALVVAFVIAGYFVFVVMPTDSGLAPADSFATNELPASNSLPVVPAVETAEPQPAVDAAEQLTASAPVSEPDPVEPEIRVLEKPSEMSATPAPSAQVRPAAEPANEPRVTTPANEASSIQINRQRRDDPVFLGLSRAYDAYQAGDVDSAAGYYRDVVALQPTNRDALLGLASLAQSAGRFEEARFYFESLLKLDPKDGVAASGLMSLRQQADSVADESTLKSMLREQPEAAQLHFTLGMRYVAQGRWPDAQTAFFDAVRFEPAHPDFNFNLAVSLDRLGKTGSAAIYYARAIDNANGLQSFDVAQARARLEALNGG